jgi:hypothetical protein
MKFVAFGLFALFAALPFGCEEHLNKGLEEEKSYTRVAMEKYRKDPKYFKGSSPGVLETWSRMDYLALAARQQKLPAGSARLADTLTFLDPGIQRDANGKPFCVLRRKEEIIVLSIFTDSVVCSPDLAAGLDTRRILSGDMEFSGMANYWIYVLRTGEKK